MGYTRTQLRDDLTTYIGSRFSDDQMNSAINAAILACWPVVSQIKEDASIQLIADFDTYVVAAADVSELGIAQVWVQIADAEDLLLRRCRQRRWLKQWRMAQSICATLLLAFSPLWCPGMTASGFRN